MAGGGPDPRDPRPGSGAALILAMAALRLVRGRLHERARYLQSHDHLEAAAALWAFVEELDELIILIARRRR